MHGRGRVFYTSLGHREDVWSTPIFQQILLGGLSWALGRLEADITPNIELARSGRLGQLHTAYAQIIQVQAGIGAQDTSAIEYDYVDNGFGDGLAARYANGVKLVLSRKHECWGGVSDQRFDGAEGWMANSGGEHEQTRGSSPALLGEVQKVLGEYTAPTGRPLNHVRNSFDCIKSRSQTVAYSEAMHRDMTTVHAANICMWLG